LILEFGTLAETVFPSLETRNWYEAGDILMMIANGYDLYRGRIITEYTFVKDGVVDRRMGSQQVWTLRELKGLLGTAGFDHVEAFAHDGSPFQLRGQRAVIVARKAL
jgi:hypothetical protein